MKGITTSTNAAYEVMKQGPGEPVGYETVDVPQRGPTQAYVEGEYEVPSAPQPPLPDLPPSKTAEEEEEGVYEAIPGDK